MVEFIKNRISRMRGAQDQEEQMERAQRYEGEGRVYEVRAEGRAHVPFLTRRKAREQRALYLQTRDRIESQIWDVYYSDGYIVSETLTR